MDSAAYIPESQQNSGQTNASQYLPPDKLLVNDEFIIEKTLEHVEEFSTEGLRTLLYSFRWIDKKYYDEWSREYSDAKISFTDRAKKIEETGSKIEQNLELIGATAIEDKLQDGVSVAIEKLRRAGIKLWMLTGDKRETAINIGYSCGLIKDYSTVVILSNDEGKDRLAQVITSAGLEIKAGRVAHCVLVIDGATLGTIEDESPLLSIFIELCIQADSTICCRASPSQKANMVSRVREVKKDSVTLAIGDGANDIAMIQSADIGVGITGKEGLQAARSADYAIAQFRFLLKLLLVNDDLLFQLFEKDLDMRRFFEQSSFKELQQGWQYPRQPSSWRIAAIKGYKFVRNKLGIIDSPVLDNVDIAPGSAVHRKRAGTDPSRGELPPSGEGQALYQGDFQKVQDGPYEILPSGKKVKIKRRDGILSKIGNTFKVGKTKDEDEDDVDAIIEARLENLRREEEEEFDNNHRAH
ncbi:drs2 neo1 protein [Cerrena zonata]|uniref:Drs2 neo1 protein n=1 Tax=Cerrena zonata TaxID=2478898 RepID=A0AAW0G776_9APHY